MVLKRLFICDSGKALAVHDYFVEVSESKSFELFSQETEL